MKRFLFAIVVLCLIFSGCAAPAENSEKNIESATAEAEIVKRAYFSVAVKGEHELILDLTVVELEENETVLEILKRLMRENKIHMETSGKGDAEYVKAINNIYEFDRGPQSGWTFYVNGEMPSEGAGKLVVNDGDMIDWVFVTDWGETE